jgi:magnesium transporter
MLNKRFASKSYRESAREIENLTLEEIQRYLTESKPIRARKVFFELPIHVVHELLPDLDDALFKKIFARSDTHRAARILSRLSKDSLDDRLALLPESVSKEILKYLDYEEDTAGSVMENIRLTVLREDLVESVLVRLREIGDRRILTVYVVDNNKALMGRVPVHYLAVAQPEQQIEELMYKPYSVQVDTSRNEILSIIEEHSLLQVPVVDDSNRLLGVIRNDVLLQASQEEASDDLQTMFGAGKEEHALSRATFAVRKRLPWLQINLVTAFLASLVVGFFEDTIAQITILAIFLPVVAGQSGNTGSQALAVTIRGLALKEVVTGQWWLVAKKELVVGLINGIVVAITTGIVVFFWSGSSGIAIVIGISMIISMVIAGFAGALIPIGLQALGQDPATSSSIVLTTVTDICGFLSFLGLASALSSVLGITG